MGEAYCVVQESGISVEPMTLKMLSCWCETVQLGHRNCQNKAVFMRVSRESQIAAMFVVVCAVWHPSTRTSSCLRVSYFRFCWL